MTNFKINGVSTSATVAAAGFALFGLYASLGAVAGAACSYFTGWHPVAAVAGGQVIWEVVVALTRTDRK